MYYVGIDLGGTNIKTGIVDEQGKIIAKSSIPTKSERTADEVAFDMAFEVLNIVKTKTSNHRSDWMLLKMCYMAGFLLDSLIIIINVNYVKCVKVFKNTLFIQND